MTFQLRSVAAGVTSGHEINPAVGSGLATSESVAVQSGFRVAFAASHGLQKP